MKQTGNSSSKPTKSWQPFCAEKIDHTRSVLSSFTVSDQHPGDELVICKISSIGILVFLVSSGQRSQVVVVDGEAFSQNYGRSQAVRSCR